MHGTIAFANFNGTTYDIHFGDIASGEIWFWHEEASQPTFSNGGERIAFHSWKNDARGLITANLDKTGKFLVGTYLEDQLPTWSPDDSQILLLSRREMNRPSILYKASANQERPEASVLAEGEYPMWHVSGQIVWRGWGNTGEGLKIATSDMGNEQSLTNSGKDTAPSISPDGSQVTFMSSRNGNWDIFVINTDGSGLSKLTEDTAADGLPTWSPDGNAIAFVSNRGGPWAIWAMTANGTGIRQLFTYPNTPDGFVASEPTQDTTRGWAEERISWTSTLLR